MGSKNYVVITIGSCVRITFQNHVRNTSETFLFERRFSLGVKSHSKNLLRGVLSLGSNREMHNAFSIVGDNAPAETSSTSKTFVNLLRSRLPKLRCNYVIIT